MPLPDSEAKVALIQHKLKEANSSLEEKDLDQVAEMTQGYSCADMNALIKEAAMTPVREIPTEELMKMEDTTKIRGIEVKDF